MTGEHLGIKILNISIARLRREEFKTILNPLDFRMVLDAMRRME